MGFVGASGHPAYRAAKGAVRIYSKAAAVRYGPSGVRVNTVHPGYMPPMLNATNAGERDDKTALTPLRRIGKPIEVAYGVLFLASDEASFVTGAAAALCKVPALRLAASAPRMPPSSIRDRLPNIVDGRHRRRRTSSTSSKFPIR
jgi:NAD(P)-dependent dehydrogenase (short-subunit alcohol dehydrogenase family)